MIVETVVTGRLYENCHLAGCEETRQAMAVDPGDDVELILEALERLRLNLTLIAVTHEHFDHIGAVTPLREATSAPLAMHRIAYERAPEMALMAEAWLGQSIPPLARPEIWLEDGKALSAGQLQFRVAACPGHAPGHVVLIGEGVAFTGDVLFRQSIGRSDLPGGDGALLLRNIRHKLLILPDETAVYPGHGPPTTIGEERRENPFLAGLE